MIRKETVVPDDTVTASWKRLIDKVETPRGKSVDGSFTDTFRIRLHPWLRAARARVRKKSAGVHASGPHNQSLISSLAGGESELFF